MAKAKRKRNGVQPTPQQAAFLGSFTRNVVEFSEEKGNAFEGIDQPVFLRELGAEDYENLTAKGGKVILHEDGTRTIDIAALSGGDRTIAAMSMCTDDSGTELLFPGDVGRSLLAGVPLRVIQPIAKQVREISGLTKKGKPVNPLDEAKKD